MIVYAKAMGVGSFFFATQCATYDLTADVLFVEFCKPYDLRIINAHKDNAWFNVIHIHGSNIIFETAIKYPLPVINWHDRQTGPTLQEARTICSKTFLGGLRDGPSIVGTSLQYDNIMTAQATSAAGLPSKGGPKALRRIVQSGNTSNCKREHRVRKSSARCSPIFFDHFLHEGRPYLGSTLPSPFHGGPAVCHGQAETGRRQLTAPFQYRTSPHPSALRRQLQS